MYVSVQTDESHRGPIRVRYRYAEERDINPLIILVMLSLLFGGGLYWAVGLGWGIGPVGLIMAALVFAYLLYDGSWRGGR
jgi:hypothetical protein